MKIAKSYLKKIIKEELDKALERNKKTISISPSDFLKLTTTPDMIQDLQNRLERAPYDPFQKAKEEPYLTINEYGKVIDHEGRLRAYILQSKNIAEFKANLKHPSNIDIDRPNLKLFNQFNDEISVTLNKSTNLPSLKDVSRDKISGELRRFVLDLADQRGIKVEEAIKSLNDELKNHTVVDVKTGNKYSIQMQHKPIISAKMYDSESKSPNSMDKLTLK